MLVALTRQISPRISQCALTHLSRVPIDVAAAMEQHRLYEDCLTRLGCEIHRVSEAPELPDAVFVEDTAIVFDELAIITRPGALSRRQETAGIAEVLRHYRELHFIQAPGTLDGGDVLTLSQRVFVGMSSRTNAAGIEQLHALLVGRGYEVTAVPVTECLHLKSAVTQVSPNTILMNRNWVDPTHFQSFTIIDVDPAEPAGANALLIDDTVIYPTSFPNTRRRMEERGIQIEAIDVSELAKAEGGVTCCSLTFRAR